MFKPPNRLFFYRPFKGADVARFLYNFVVTDRRAFLFFVFYVCNYVSVSSIRGRGSWSLCSTFCDFTFYYSSWCKRSAATFTVILSHPWRVCHFFFHIIVFASSSFFLGGGAVGLFLKIKNTVFACLNLVSSFRERRWVGAKMLNF